MMNPFFRMIWVLDANECLFFWRVWCSVPCGFRCTEKKKLSTTSKSLCVCQKYIRWVLDHYDLCSMRNIATKSRFIWWREDTIILAANYQVMNYILRWRTTIRLSCTLKRISKLPLMICLVSKPRQIYFEATCWKASIKLFILLLHHWCRFILVEKWETSFINFNFQQHSLGRA